MILTELRNHFLTVKKASLTELKAHFNADLAVLRDMLDFLLRKGQICKTTKTSRCGIKCQQCSPIETEVYQWVKR